MFFTSVLVPSSARPCRTHRDVGVAPETPFFHVAVVDADRHQNLAEAAEGFGSVRGRPQIRLRHDLDERRAAAVEIDVAAAVGVWKTLVQRLASVLFHVHARDADAPGGSRRGELERRRRWRAAARTAKSGSPWAGPDRSSSCGRKSSAPATGIPAPEPLSPRNRSPAGSGPAAHPAAPGRPGRHSCWARSPNRVPQPQKILVSVSSRAWISRPMTGSQRGAAIMATDSARTGPPDQICYDDVSLSNGKRRRRSVVTMSRRDQMTAAGVAVNEPLVEAPVRPADSEAELAGQVQDLLAGGSAPAARDLFSQIVVRQQRRAARIAWHYLHDPADADEAVQDAFVKAYTHIASFQRHLSFEVWFTRILINGCLDRQKARARRARWIAAFGRRVPSAGGDRHRDERGEPFAGGPAAGPRVAQAAGRRGQAASRAAAARVSPVPLCRSFDARCGGDDGAERINRARPSLPCRPKAARRHGGTP